MKRLYFASLDDCNENCIFCVRRGDDPRIKFIDTKKAKKLLANKKKQGYGEVYFDGGEPTLRKDLAELIAFAEAKGYKKINVLTNGVKLADKALAAKLITSNNSNKSSLSFSVSLHSHKKDISEKLVGRKNTYGKTISGIRNLIDLGCPNISIYHIITKYNYRFLPDFVGFMNKKFPEVKNITFSFIYPVGAALKNKHIYPQLSKAEKYFQKALKLCKKYRILFSVTTCGTIPLCFLKGYEDIMIKQQEIDQPDKVGLLDTKQDTKYQLATKKFHKMTKVKTTDCKKCLYDSKCGGIWKDYVEMYGLSEFKPRLAKKEKQRKPNVLLLLTGFSCNNNCAFCSNLANRDYNTPKEELFKKIKQGQKDGFNILELIGGEVTIRPDFLDLVKYGKKVGFKDIRLTTNARVFSYPEFVKKAWRAGLNAVVVSLYGHNKKLHDAVTRTPGSFDQTVQGIKNINKHTKLYLIVNTVVSKINYQQLKEIGLFASGLQAQEWHPLELLPDGRAIKNYHLFAVAYHSLSKYINEAAALAGNKLKQIDFFDFPYCIFDKKYLDKIEINYINPQIRFEDIDMQASDETFRIKKIKQGQKIVYQDKYKIKPKICQRCRYYSQCGGVTHEYFDKYGISKIEKMAYDKGLIT